MSFESNGWKLLFTDEMKALYDKLTQETDAILSSTRDIEHPKVKLRKRIEAIIFQEVPRNPGDPEYLLGNTLGQSARHWRRVKFNRRFRLFFWYNTKISSIVYAWLNDENTLRKAGSDTDPYVVFRKKLDQGNPPNTWDELLAACKNENSVNR